MDNNNFNAEIRKKRDWYLRNKEKCKKLSIASGILLAIFLVLTVVFGIKLSAVSANGQKVTVTVEYTEDADFGNVVYVRYNHNRYELINVLDSELYKYETCRKLGRPIEVLRGEDGRLYSNTYGIKNSTMTGKMYFAFLELTFALIFSTAILIGCVVEAKKREKGIYPKV